MAPLFCVQTCLTTRMLVRGARYGLPFHRDGVRRLATIVRVAGIGHLGQRFVNLLFCLLDILEGIQEQRSEIFFGI